MGRHGANLTVASTSATSLTVLGMNSIDAQTFSASRSQLMNTKIILKPYNYLQPLIVPDMARWPRPDHPDALLV